MRKDFNKGGERGWEKTLQLGVGEDTSARGGIAKVS